MPAKKQVLVCGASGFIGRNVSERLALNGNYEVIGTYFQHEPAHKNPNIKYVKADLTDAKTVSDLVKGKDIVLHHAAIATNFKDVLTQPHIHTTHNVIMTSLLIRAAFEAKVSHFLFSSCGYLYNTSDKPHKETEQDYNNLPSTYFAAAWSKLYCEKMCEFYSTLNGPAFTVLRQANVYGPYDKLNLDTAHALPATVMKAISSRDGKLEIWGDGTQARDLVYVSDLVDCIETIVDKKASTKEPRRYDFLNIGNGEFYTMKQIADQVVRCSPKPLEVVYNTAKPSSALIWRLDSSLARERYNWKPKVSLEEGIRKTYDWYSKVL